MVIEIKEQFAIEREIDLMTWVYFLAHKNDVFDAFKSFAKKFKKKKVFVLLVLEMIMESNLKINFLTFLVMKMASLKTILLLEHHNK